MNLNFINCCADTIVTLQELTVLKFKEKSGNVKKTRIISEASHKWRDIACLLCDDPVPSLSSKYYTEDPQNLLRQIFVDYFIDKKSRMYPQTWNGLLELLDDVGLESLAERVKEALSCM